MYNSKKENDFVAKEFETRLSQHDFDVPDHSLFEEVVSTFGVKRMTALYKDLADNMDYILEKSAMDKYAKYHPLLLGKALVSYFCDLYGQSIQSSDDMKALAYLAYWLLKVKPIQINDCESVSKEKTQASLCLNEKFIATYVLSHLVDNFQQEQLSQALKETIHFFQYQLCTPQSLEALLLSVLAHLNGTK